MSVPPPVSADPPVGADSFVRDGRRADAAGLARIQVSRWRTGYAGLVPEPVLAELTSEQALAQWQEHWAQSLASPPTSRHRVLTAVGSDPSGGQLVAGFAAFGPATDDDRWPATDAELYVLCVAPQQRRDGHGSRLLNAAAATLATDGFTLACTWVLERDEAAQRFLAEAGWAADGARRTLDMGEPVASVRLHTALEPPAEQ